MSGGAFGYKELQLDELYYAMDVYRTDPDLSEKIKDYIQGLMVEIETLRYKVKKLDYYLSGESMGYK